jgi:hypothetical protein
VTDQPTCDRCHEPIHDQAYVCPQCTRRLRRDLETVARVAGEAWTTIARLDRIGGRNGRAELEPEDTTCACEPCRRGRRDKADNALAPRPWPINLAAARRHDAAVNELTTWVRHIAQTRGAPGPEPPRGHPLAAAATWLTGHLDWLRHRPEAAEAFDALGDACRVLVRIVDRPPERVVVGQCPCQVVTDGGRPPEYLYAIRGAAQVACRSCGTTYDVDSSRDELKRQLDQALFTAAELATLVAYFGEGQREPVRKLINQWHVRGMIVAHDYQGQPAYRFGEVVARLASSRRAS